MWLWVHCARLRHADSVGVACAMLCNPLAISSLQSGICIWAKPPLDEAAGVGVAGTGGGERLANSAILKSASSRTLLISASADMRSLATCSWAYWIAACMLAVACAWNSCASSLILCIAFSAAALCSCGCTQGITKLKTLIKLVPLLSKPFENYG